MLALLNGDVAVKPATLMVSKVTVKKNKYTNIFMGSVQAGIANGVLDAVRDGTIPRDEVDKIGIIAAVWLYPEVVEATDLDFEDLFNDSPQEHARRDQESDDRRADDRLAAGEPGQDRPQLPQEGAGRKTVTCAVAHRSKGIASRAICQLICALRPCASVAPARSTLKVMARISHGRRNHHRRRRGRAEHGHAARRSRRQRASSWNASGSATARPAGPPACSASCAATSSTRGC